jgi:hypothetical protein
VLSTILPAAELRASRPEPERQRLRNVTFVPEHGGEVVLERLRSAEELRPPAVALRA